MKWLWCCLFDGKICAHHTWGLEPPAADRVRLAISRADDASTPLAFLNVLTPTREDEP
jgi:hypothetical protein